MFTDINLAKWHTFSESTKEITCIFEICRLYSTHSDVIKIF